MIREHFLEEDAFGQGGAGNGECRGQSRVAGTTGWLLPGGGGVEVRDRDGGARPAGRGVNLNPILKVKAEQPQKALYAYVNL